MTRDNGVAIVGMSCRFPGADNVSQFWENLRVGVDTISRFTPQDSIAAGVDPELAWQARYVPARGVISDADCFDWSFFGYSPAEARSIDPQQRIFLECCSQAIDDAGIDPERLPGWIGVFAGSDPSVLWFDGKSDDVLQQILGRDKDYLATRVAYKLRLRGPAVTVQTACSTSLVAVHLACQSLLNYECDAALAGGVAVWLPQSIGYLYEEGGIMSPDGYCRPFDAAGKGTVSSNGAGVVVLRRLDDALSDRDRIIAVIRGSAINNDGGAKIGFTAPSMSGQRDVIKLAMSQASADPADITYVETHGTGTKLGDPIELAGLSAAFGEPASDASRCWIGAVKGNIGHAGAAAGMAGLIKLACMLSHRELVPAANFSRPNPELRLETTPFRVCTSSQPWGSGGSLLAGVSSFGIGGTNAHAVLESPPARPRRAAADRDAQVFCLCAATGDALATLRHDVADLLDVGGPPLGDAAWTLATGRRQFPVRSAFVAAGRQDAVEELRTAPAPCDAGSAVRVAFLFPGQGTLTAGAGASCHALLDRFRECFDQARDLVRRQFGVDLGALLREDTERDWFLDTQHQQLGLFTLGYALARQLAAWGVTPSGLLGNSIGEYVAAAIAGVWDLADALTVVGERGRVMRESPPGRMLAVELPPADLARLLERDGSPALAVDTPGYAVLSGTAEQISRSRDLVGEARARLLDTGHAFHSPLMRPAGARLGEMLSQVPARAPGLPLISNVTGDWWAQDLIAEPDYWVSQLCQPVRLRDGLGTLLAGGYDLYLELGPGTSMTGALRGHENWDAAPLALPLIGKSAERQRETLLTAMGRLWERGADVAWAPVFDGDRPFRCALPAHPLAATSCGTPATAASLPARHDDVAVYAWRGRRWWARRDQGADASASGAKESAGKPRFGVVTFGLADGANLVASLAGDGLRVAASAHVGRPVTPPPRPSVIAGELRARRPESAAPDSLPSREDLTGPLTSYCAALVGQYAVRQAGIEPGDSYDRRELASRLSPEGRLPGLTGVVTDLLLQQGWLRPAGGGYQVSPNVETSIAVALSARAELGEVSGLCRLLEHCVTAYPDVLAGVREPLSVLYPGGDDEPLARFLAGNEIAISDAGDSLETLLQAVRAYRARRGSDSIRILEIGAGQAEFARRLFTDWPDHGAVEYHLTDISPLVVQRASARCRVLNPGAMRFSTFDISSDPVAQGLAPGTFDLVIGYNVVHVAARIRPALRNLSRLLKPGGWLGLVEVTQVPCWTHLIWGLAPGWWDFDDDLRSTSVHLDADGWTRVLAETGFADVVRVPAHADHPDPDHMLFLAAAPGPGAGQEAEFVAAEFRRQAAKLDYQVILYLADLAGIDDLGKARDAVELWERLRQVGFGLPVPGWAISSDPAPSLGWRADLIRQGFDPVDEGAAAGAAPASGHLEIARLEAEDLAAVIRMLPDLPAPIAVRADAEALARAGRRQAPSGPAIVSESPPISRSQRPEPRPADQGTAVEAIWRDVLGVSTARAADDFFALGGESLMALKLLALIERNLGAGIPMADFVAAPTLGNLARLAGLAPQPEPPDGLARGGTAPGPEPTRADDRRLGPGIVALRPGRSRPPLFLVAPAAGTSLAYVGLARALNDDRPVYGLDSPGLADGSKPLPSLERIAARQVELVRQVSPAGPYLLGGWSVGAIVAHEMARQLEHQGADVDLLICIEGQVADTNGRPMAAMPRFLLQGTWFRACAALGIGQPGRQVRHAPGARAVFAANVSAMLGYRPAPVRCRAVIFTTSKRPRARRRLERTAAPLYERGLSVRVLAGNHWTVLSRANLPVLARQISEELEDPKESE